MFDRELSIASGVLAELLAAAERRWPYAQPVAIRSNAVTCEWEFVAADGTRLDRFPTLAMAWGELCQEEVHTLEECDG